MSKSYNKPDPDAYRSVITHSDLTIYDAIEIGSDLWIPSEDLESILNTILQGLSLQGLPLRTRSKFVKEKICEALGYPVPAIFRKSHPRFPGQDFDIYIQKSNNLQIWNEEIAPSRRYVLMRVTEDDTISKVKVITGTNLATLDTTGTLTQKYQARLIAGAQPSELISSTDTRNIRFPTIHSTARESRFATLDMLINHSGQFNHPLCNRRVG